jgi:hypothetical protein
MRVQFFNPQKFDTELKGIALKRLKDAASVIEKEAINLCPTGTVSRPMYKKGPYKDQPWTSRDKGRLKKSIRKVIYNPHPRDFAASRMNVRVYAGHYMAYYAAIVENGKHFMRRAKNKSMKKVKEIIGVQ